MDVTARGLDVLLMEIVVFGVLDGKLTKVIEVDSLADDVSWML